MNSGSPVLPLATADEAVRYVVIDDEPMYRQGIGQQGGHQLIKVGDYPSIETFLTLQRKPCHVVVLDLCLNRQTGDKAVRQGVRAIRELVEDFGQRVLIYTAEERPEPVARCVAAGAAGYVSKYNGDAAVLACAVDEIGRNGSIVTDSLHDALRQLIPRCRDIRLSETLEATLVLLDGSMTDIEVAQERGLSPRTIEDHKRKILKLLGDEMELRSPGFPALVDELGIAPGNLVNDEAAQRPQRGLINRAMPWLRRGRDT